MQIEPTLPSASFVASSDDEQKTPDLVSQLARMLITPVETTTQLSCGEDLHRNYTLGSKAFERWKHTQSST